MNTTDEIKQSKYTGLCFIWSILVKFWPDGVLSYGEHMVWKLALEPICSEAAFNQNLTKSLEVKYNLVYFDCLIPFLIFILHYLAYIMHYSWNKQKVSNHTVEVCYQILSQILAQNCSWGSLRLVLSVLTVGLTPWQPEHSEQVHPRRSP
jgi:hypothetical protein